MKILIIEDEALAAGNLAKMIKKILPDVHILDSITSVHEAITWFSKNDAPDLLFADIQLSDGNSFEIFESINIECQVIFTTAYNQFALRAFKLNSVDYLLKPIDEMELQKAIEKYKKLGDNSYLRDQVSRMLGDLKSTNGNDKKYKERFLVMYKNALRPMQVAEIACFQKDELIFAIGWDNQRYICEFQSMDELDDLLDPTCFYRANRQFILHINNIALVKNTHKGICAILKTPVNMQVDISREKARDFKYWLEN
ncbi:MAG: LytR/AlgR family response regulator transcription factor [Cyclobacteriaceae bacterium]